MKIPDNYMHWRISQGFNREQAKVLFLTLDGMEENMREMWVWLRSKGKGTGDSIHEILELWHKAQERFVEQHGGEIGPMTLIVRMAESLPRVTTTTSLAFAGHYDSAMILLRTAIEGILRSTLTVVDELSADLNENIRRCEAKWNWEKFPEGWRGALQEDSNQTVGTMAIALGKMKLTTPIDLYHYLEVKTLNSFTHANMKTIELSDENILRTGRFKTFDQDKFDTYVRIHGKVAESVLIIWQNILDLVDHHEQPLLTPGRDYDEELMPQLTKLIQKRKVVAND